MTASAWRNGKSSNKPSTAAISSLLRVKTMAAAKAAHQWRR